MVYLRARGLLTPIADRVAHYHRSRHRAPRAAAYAWADPPHLDVIHRGDAMLLELAYQQVQIGQAYTHDPRPQILTHHEKR